jgi:hypothetical protein
MQAGGEFKFSAFDSDSKRETTAKDLMGDVTVRIDDLIAANGREKAYSLQGPKVSNRVVFTLLYVVFALLLMLFVSPPPYRFSRTHIYAFSVLCCFPLVSNVVCGVDSHVRTSMHGLKTNKEKARMLLTAHLKPVQEPIQN